MLVREYICTKNFGRKAQKAFARIGTLAKYQWNLFLIKIKSKSKNLFSFTVIFGIKEK